MRARGHAHKHAQPGADDRFFFAKQDGLFGDAHIDRNMYPPPFVDIFIVIIHRISSTTDVLWFFPVPVRKEQ